MTYPKECMQIKIFGPENSQFGPLTFSFKPISSFMIFFHQFSPQTILWDSMYDLLVAPPHFMYFAQRVRGIIGMTSSTV